MRRNIPGCPDSSDVNALSPTSLKVSRSLAKTWTRRRVEPEVLDAIPPDHPEAKESRAELDTINLLMSNHHWVAGVLRRLHQPGWRLLEIGAGSGRLGKKLADSGWPATAMIGMDVSGRPAQWPEPASWVKGDILQDAIPDAEVIVANLLLHQFKNEELKELGRRLPAAARVVISVDPLRARRSLWMGRLVAFLTRMNRITVHDMVLSVHAGFRGNELPDALELQGWRTRAWSTFRGGYRMRADRLAGAHESS